MEADAQWIGGAAASFFDAGSTLVLLSEKKGVITWTTFHILR